MTLVFSFECLFYLFSNAGYRQSYSGSETSTDVSLSSNENLCTLIRQDPQGEENSHPALGTPTPQHPGVSFPDALQQAFIDTQWGGLDAQNSILARLGMHVPSKYSDFYLSKDSKGNSVSIYLTIPFVFGILQLVFRNLCTF